MNGCVCGAIVIFGIWCLTVAFFCYQIICVFFFCQTHFHTFKTDMIMKNFLPSISIEETCKVYLVKTLFCQILYLYIDTHVLIKKTKLQNVDYVVRAS